MTQFKKYPKIYRLGSEDIKEFMDFGEDLITIEEKVDGGNGSFWIDDDKKIHVGSRNRDLVQEEDEKTFAKQRATLKELLEKKVLVNGELKDRKIDPDYYYYIEWMAKHSISYTNAPDIIGLDIRAKRSMTEDFGLFISREEKERLFNELGIETTPLVGIMSINELHKKDVLGMIPQSKYYDGKAEGIVLKNYSRKAKHGNYQLFAKVVAEEFKEKNKLVFGSIKNKETDTEKIVTQYCTDARIVKHIEKLRNEENLPLRMELMRHLPRGVSQDILTEEITGIFDAYKWMDFKSFKQLITKKCCRVLKNYMLEEATK